MYDNNILYIMYYKGVMTNILEYHYYYYYDIFTLYKRILRVNVRVIVSIQQIITDCLYKQIKNILFKTRASIVSNSVCHGEIN